MAYLYVGGALILFALFRLLRKKEKAIPTLTGYKPSPVLLPSNKLSIDEIFRWISQREGKAQTQAVPDGKTKDGDQLYSIGYGHQIQPNERELLTATLNSDQMVDLFVRDIEKMIDQMNRKITFPINKNQQLALISLRYNIGPEAFNESTLLKLVNKGDLIEASKKFAEWRLSEGKISQGLVNRRELERQLFLTPVSQYGTYIPAPIPPLGTGNFPKF